MTFSNCGNSKTSDQCQFSFMPSFLNVVLLKFQKEKLPKFRVFRKIENFRIFKFTAPKI